MMISTKYAVHLCCLLGLALVPTVIHSYWGEVEDDGRRSAAIGLQLAGYTGVPSSRGGTWGQRRFDTDDWIERLYRKPGEEIQLTVVRSFDLKSLYHHPELAIIDNVAFRGHRVRRNSSRPEVPIFELEPGPGVSASASYVLLSDQQFVETPIRFQLQAAGELLFSRRRPLTLFFVVDRDGSRRNPTADAMLPADRVLLAAVDSFLGQSGTPEQATP